MSILKIEAVKQKIGFSKSKIYQMIKQGKFPKPQRLKTGRSSRWLEVVVDQWIVDNLVSKDL